MISILAFWDYAVILFPQIRNRLTKTGSGCENHTFHLGIDNG